MDKNFEIISKNETYLTSGSSSFQTSKERKNVTTTTASGYNAPNSRSYYYNPKYHSMPYESAPSYTYKLIDEINKLLFSLNSNNEPMDKFNKSQNYIRNNLNTLNTKLILDIEYLTKLPITSNNQTDDLNDTSIYINDNNKFLEDYLINIINLDLFHLVIEDYESISAIDEDTDYSVKILIFKQHFSTYLQIINPLVVKTLFNNDKESVDNRNKLIDSYKKILEFFVNKYEINQTPLTENSNENEATNLSKINEIRDILSNVRDIVFISIDKDKYEQLKIKVLDRIDEKNNNEKIKQTIYDKIIHLENVINCVKKMVKELKIEYNKGNAVSEGNCNHDELDQYEIIFFKLNENKEKYEKLAVLIYLFDLISELKRKENKLKLKERNTKGFLAGENVNHDNYGV